MYITLSTLVLLWTPPEPAPYAAVLALLPVSKLSFLGSRIKCGFDIRHFLVYFISVLGDSRFHYEPFNIAHWCRLAFSSFSSFLSLSIERMNFYLRWFLLLVSFSFYVNQFHFFPLMEKFVMVRRGEDERERKGETGNVKKEWKTDFCREATGKVKYKRFAIKILIWFEEHINRGKLKGKGIPPDMSTRDTSFRLYGRRRKYTRWKSFSIRTLKVFFPTSMSANRLSWNTINFKIPLTESIE